MKAALPFVVEWRQAIVAAPLPLPRSVEDDARVPLVKAERSELFCHLPRGALTSTERLVALVLSIHMNAAGGSCWPSAKKVARESGLSERAVRASLSRIPDAGWLIATERVGRTTMYQATIPRGVQLVQGSLGEGVQVLQGGPAAVAEDPGTSFTRGSSVSRSRSSGAVRQTLGFAQARAWAHAAGRRMDSDDAAVVLDGFGLTELERRRIEDELAVLRREAVHNSTAEAIAE